MGVVGGGGMPGISKDKDFTNYLVCMGQRLIEITRPPIGGPRETSGLAAFLARGYCA